MIIEVIRGLNLGGAETLLYNRLKHAVSTNPRGYEDTVVVNTLANASFFTQRIRDLGIQVLEISTPNPVIGLVELSRLIDRRSPSTVVFHSPVTSYLEKIKRALGRRGPRLIDVVHSTQYRTVYGLAGRALNRFADVGIAVSDDVRTSSTGRYYKRTTTLLAGADVEGMRAWIGANPDAPSEFRKSLGLPPEQRMAVAVGSLFRNKGHRHLIDAISDERLSETCAVIVGEGEEREPLLELARARGIEDRVKLLGRVPDGWRWTAVADVLVHPSHYEGLPVTLMEAAALGTPIVATDVGGANQVLEKGAHGTLIAAPETRLVADAMVSQLGAAPSISSVFGSRATGETYWSLARFAQEFYQTLA